MREGPWKRAGAVSVVMTAAPQSWTTTGGRAEAGSVLLFALSLEGLLVEVSLDLFAEHQHAQVGVGGFVHGFGLDAHAILLRRQLVRALFLVPQVKKAGHGRADHNQVAAEVLPVQVDVFHAPAFDFKIKSTCRIGGDSLCISFQWIQR